MTDATLQESWLAGIEHENFHVRSVMLRILADERRLNGDPAMAAIRQIEKHGWRGAFEFPHQVTDLPHSKESLEWVSDWLEASAPRAGDEEQQIHFARWFCKAPVDWFELRIGRFVETLMAASPPETGSIRSQPAVFANPDVDFKRAVDRMAVAMWTDDECQAELDEVLDHCAASEDFPQAEILRLEEVCETLAARGLFHEEAAGTWLEIADPDPEREVARDDYRAGAALKIIGHGRLKPPVERIVRLMELDWDWTNELVEGALVAGGDRNTLERILDFFPALKWEQKLYLSSAVERLRFEGLEERLIDVLRLEEADDIRVCLARGLALYGTEAGITVAREIVAESPEDPERIDVAEILCAQDVVRGNESDETRRQLELMDRRFRKRQLSLEHLDSLMTAPRRAPGATKWAEAAPPLIPASPKPAAGRNDPCPCGSGRKFKKCCL